MAEKYNITRNDKPHLKKAGNLRNAFKQTESEFIVIFDADFCPVPDFIQQTIPYLIEDSKLATPQYFRVLKGQNWVERGAGNYFIE